MKVYFTGGDNSGWALDTDIKYAKQAIGKFCEVVDRPWKADVIHSVSPLTTYNKKLNKEYVAVFPGNPNRLFEADNDFIKIARKYPCVGQTYEAYKLLQKANIPQSYYAPYIADLENYHEMDDKIKLREEFGIPSGKMVIGNFMRDSLGNDIQSAKPEKGADLFCEIVRGVAEKVGKRNICVLLAGPRRHWIRKKLTELEIQFIYIGKEMEGDDYEVNILSNTIMNRLLNACDIILVSSRSEGGPRVILEASQAKIPIISSDVGIARDILNESVIFHSILQAQEMLIKHYYTSYLQDYCQEHYQKVNRNCSIDSVSEIYKKIYSEIEGVKVRKTKFVFPIKYKRNRIKSIGIIGYKETDFFCKVLYYILQKMGINVYIDKDTKRVDVLVYMPWVNNIELKGIHYTKKYAYCIPNISNKVSYAKNITAYDGMIFLNREIWHQYLIEEKPLGKEIVLSNYIMPKVNSIEGINILLAKEECKLQKALEEAFCNSEISVLPEGEGLVDTIEKANIYISNCNAEENVFATSVVLHYGIITVYADIGDNGKTFGVQSFGYDTVPECVENIKYIISNLKNIQELVVSKDIKEIATGLLNVL